MDDCIFCKIVRGELPSYKLLETENVFVFFSKPFITKCHLLVIPKEHYAELKDVPDDILAEIIVISKKVVKALDKTFNLKGINILQRNRPGAGQAVFHYHMHIVPRYEDDNIENWHSEHNFEDNIEAEKLLGLINKNITL